MIELGKFGRAAFVPVLKTLQTVQTLQALQALQTLQPLKTARCTARPKSILQFP